MLNFTERIKSFVSPKHHADAVSLTSLDFVRNRRGILRELMLSKQSGNIIGVYSKALGEGMFLTCVEKTETTTNTAIVTFSKCDVSGKILPRTKVSIDEIQMVCPFNKSYRNSVDTKEDKANGLYKSEVGGTFW